ncbi:MAG: hypothetical protein QOF36_499 [Microbacteriaceae bacterium]|nr:hypothetical protein [Microbacteriaceae bacterium]
MAEITHDPSQFAADLGAKLATRSRHVCALLGAGASRACQLPDVAGLQQEVAQELEEADRKHFEQLLAGRNLEQVLSRLRRIAALLEGDQKIDDLTAPAAEALDRSICTVITQRLNLDRANLEPMRRFAAWAVRADYHSPLELFTVNYDLLLEAALEELRGLWFDGFVGSLGARFKVELVEGLRPDEREALPSGFVRLWKLHGSLNWAWHGDPAEIIRLGRAASGEEIAAIYPADTKYEESRRVPFVVLMDRFRRALHESESLVLVSGYSFADDDLNELIYDAAARRPRSEFVVFCFSDIPEALAERALRTPGLSVVTKDEAILGGQRGKWEREEDAPGVWEGAEFQLGDFAALAAFLARSQERRNDRDE